MACMLLLTIYPVPKQRVDQGLNEDQGMLGLAEAVCSGR